MNIIENSKSHLTDFIHLNEEWISQYFKIKETDKKLAANPYQIIENGGYIFTLLSEDKVIGVSALFNEGNGVFELARMAVSPKHHGNGYGGLLIEHCFSKLKEIKAKKVYLVSNTKLKSAMGLYKKHGFNTVSEGPHPEYSRANVVMEMYVL